MVGFLVVAVLVVLGGSAVGMLAIMWRVQVGTRREIADGDYSLDGNVFAPPPPGRGFHPPGEMSTEADGPSATEKP